MAVELLLPGRRISAPKPPSYLALDMAFGVGNPAILGDKSRYRSHGAIVGAVPAAGVHGYCLDFDPTIPSYVSIPAAHTQLNFTSEDFSIVERVRFDALGVFSEIFDRGRAAVEGYYLGVAGAGRIEVETSQLAASQVTRTANGSVVVNTWYTLGISRNGASVRVYRNGIDITTAPAVHIDPLTATRIAYIGVGWNGAANAFDGKIEFCRVFRNIALQPSEHLAWHNALV